MNLRLELGYVRFRVRERRVKIALNGKFYFWIELYNPQNSLQLGLGLGLGCISLKITSRPTTALSNSIPKIDISLEISARLGSVAGSRSCIAIFTASVYMSKANEGRPMVRVRVRFRGLGLGLGLGLGFDSRPEVVTRDFARG